jgi:transcriptional regulator with XRE-family HTH domain
VSFLSLLESGDRQPSLDVLRRIAQAVGLQPEALILMLQTFGMLIRRWRSSKRASTILCKLRIN